MRLRLAVEVAFMLLMLLMSGSAVPGPGTAAAEATPHASLTQALRDLLLDGDATDAQVEVERSEALVSLNLALVLALEARRLAVLRKVVET